MATAGMALASGSDGKKDKQGASSGGPATATAGVNATGRFDPEAGEANSDVAFFLPSVVWLTLSISSLYRSSRCRSAWGGSQCHV